ASRSPSRQLSQYAVLRRERDADRDAARADAIRARSSDERGVTVRCAPFGGISALPSNGRADTMANFGAESTTDEVLGGVDLTGKRILITGVSAGLGVESTRALMAHGADVVGAARDLDKARRATATALEGAPKRGSLELVALDLASLASVRACADALLAARKPFDVVIANAGVMACPQGKTADGFETQFGTNHLGHFVFVNRIAPLLKSGSRVVNLSSAGHRFADVDLEDENFERAQYQPFVSYGRSKTANILFSVGLDRRLSK